MPGVLEKPVAARTEAPSRSGRNLALLGGVAVFYLVVQLVLVPPGTFLGWDEALYLSQFAHGVPPAILGAPRAVGMGYLVAPITLVTTWVPAIRVCLSVLSAAGLFLAYWPWLRLRDGLAVPLAALLFATLWVTVFYGNEAMPNVYVAYGGLAATGLFLLPRSRARLAGLALIFTVVAFARPTDTVWAAAPLLAGAVLVPAWRDLRTVLAIGGGTVLGCLPWLIDSYERFGGVLHRAQLISKENATGLHFVLFRHLQALSDGRLVCGAWETSCGGYAVSAVLWWALVPVLIALSLRRTPYLRDGVFVVLAAVAVAVPYIFVTGHANPRYLLPCYALLALPVADGIVRRRGRHSGRRRPVLAALLALHICAQLWATHQVASFQFRNRHPDTVAAAQLAALGLRPPCLVYGNNAPQIAFATGCLAWGRPYGEPSARQARSLVARFRKTGRRVAMISIVRKPGRSPAGWWLYRVLPDRDWYVRVPVRSFNDLGRKAAHD